MAVVDVGFGAGGVSADDQAKLDALTLDGGVLDIDAVTVRVNPNGGSGTYGRLEVYANPSGGTIYGGRLITSGNGPRLDRGTGADADNQVFAYGLELPSSNLVRIYQTIDGQGKTPTNLPISAAGLELVELELSSATLAAAGAVSTYTWDTNKTLAVNEYVAYMWMSSTAISGGSGFIGGGLGRSGDGDELFANGGADLAGGAVVTDTGYWTATGNGKVPYRADTHTLAVQVDLYGGRTFDQITGGTITGHFFVAKAE